MPDLRRGLMVMCPSRQFRQLGDVGGDAPRFVAGQTDRSPSRATQRYVGNRGKSGSAGLALETALMTHRCHGRYNAAIQLRRMLQFSAKGEETHEAAGIHHARW
jgi:hypothetical protein